MGVNRMLINPRERYIREEALKRGKEEGKKEGKYEGNWKLLEHC